MKDFVRYLNVITHVKTQTDETVLGLDKNDNFFLLQDKFVQRCQGDLSVSAIIWDATLAIKTSRRDEGKLTGVPTPPINLCPLKTMASLAINEGSG